MKLYQVKRDMSRTLKDQKAEIRKRYINAAYISSDGRIITVFADGKRS